MCVKKNEAALYHRMSLSKAKLNTRKGCFTLSRTTAQAAGRPFQEEELGAEMTLPPWLHRVSPPWPACSPDRTRLEGHAVADPRRHVLNMCLASSAASEGFGEQFTLNLMMPREVARLPRFAKVNNFLRVNNQLQISLTGALLSGQASNRGFG